MPLKVSKVTADDFERMAKHIFHKGGDLAAPALPVIWKTSDSDEENLERLKWSLKQQRDMFDEDPTAHFVMVEDTDKDNDILSLARWHFYEHGFKYPEFTAMELNGTKPDAEETWPAKINVPMAKKILLTIFSERPEWAGNGPQWFLTTLITREAARKRGAGGMLVDWGVQQAIKDKVPAYVEASKSGAPLYKKCGFHKVGEFRADLTEFGFPEPFTADRMVANAS